jgi:hypothetical protein
MAKLPVRVLIAWKVQQRQVAKAGERGPVQFPRRLAPAALQRLRRGASNPITVLGSALDPAR